MHELFLQILKILKHQSVRGLSVISFELEVIGYTIALAYCVHKGLPFSAYGELAFLLIQGIVESTKSPACVAFLEKPFIKCVTDKN